MSEPGRDPTDEFKRRFSGISACRNLREFCKENRIDYAFENLSVYSEDDHLSVALDRPSEIPMFDSLESTVILEEYDSHPVPESTYCGPYKGLYGGDFLIAYFKDHGITDEEIELYIRWDCLPIGRMRSRLTANALGIKYAKDRAESIIAYRDVTANTLWDGKYPPPWEHPYSMSFYVINNIDRIPDELPIYDIYMCEYKGKRYYYGVGKEETPITEDMRHNGTWYVYTWDI
ncbi:MAG: hypothetical protein IJS65_04030 [Clostridia bacterium]|nr:hypothetical protein [Clostridia bacterium]